VLREQTATNEKSFEGSRRCIDTVERRLKWQADADSLAAARDYRLAHRYVRERRFAEAIPLFDRALKEKQAGPQDFQIVARLVAIRKLYEAGGGY